MGRHTKRINEELDTAATWTDVNVKTLTVNKQLSKLSEHPVSRTLVKAPGANEIQISETAWAAYGVRGGRGCRRSSALPTRIVLVVVSLSALRACPHFRCSRSRSPTQSAATPGHARSIGTDALSRRGLARLVRFVERCTHSIANTKNMLAKTASAETPSHKPSHVLS